MGDVKKTSLDSLRIDRTATRATSRWPWVLVVVLVIVGIGAFLQFGNDAPEVTTALVIERTAGNGGSASGATVLNASGYVNARRQATVSSKTTGKIVEVLIEEGMKVEEGDVLARLDASNLETSFRLAEAQRESARSAIAETRVRLTQAERDFERVQKLIEEAIASASDYDNAEAEVKSQQARLLRQQADIGVAERQIEFYKQQLDDLVIRAPFTGVVVSKDAQPGEMISPVSAGGGFTRTGICTLVDMNSLEIEVDVNEAYINRVSPDQPATAVLDAYPDWTIPCSVIAIIPTADRQKATVKVRIAFNDIDERVLPDMGVKVAFQEASAPGKIPSGVDRKLEIPAMALQSDNGSDFVWVFNNNQVTKRPVSVAGREGDSILIDTGLSAGEHVVTANFEELQNGQRAIHSNP